MGGFKMRLAKVLPNPVSGLDGASDLLTEPLPLRRKIICMQPIKQFTYRFNVTCMW